MLVVSSSKPKLEKVYYVYRDNTIDFNRVFYVGKGQIVRIRSIGRRNSHWQAIVNKHGWTLDNREIILATKDHQYALDIEMYYIHFHKTFERAWPDGSGWGANHSAGGTGSVGHIGGMLGKNHSEQAKQKISESKLGDKHPYFNKKFPKEWKNNWRDGGSIGEKNPAAILNEQQVLEIIEKYKTGTYSQRTLGLEYNVSGGCIKHIISGKTWNHIKKDNQFIIKKQKIIKIAPPKIKKIRKLSLKDVINIREEYRHKEALEIAQKYNISRSLVYSIANGHSWKDKL